MGGRGYQSKIDSLTARMAAALVLLGQLRPALRTNHTMGLADKIAETLTLPAPTTTPAEARTGISDRNAAALAAASNLRQDFETWRGADQWLGQLDVIEQALRADGAA